MQDPHEICCQHCYVTFGICDGKNCAHDVRPSVNDLPHFGLQSRGVAYVGFCERWCSAVRPKASRIGQYTDNQKPETVREKAFAALDSANAGLERAAVMVTISMESLVAIMRRHGVTPSQILCVVFDVRMGHGKPDA